jgi:hypothetical protein
MKRISQPLKMLLACCLLTWAGCKSNNSEYLKNVFEKTSLNGSPSYYFPSILNDTMEDRNPSRNDFTQKWYSYTLYSFQEPILYTKSDSVNIYRILWLRSFDKPVCFTIKEYKGEYYLNAKTLDQHPDFYSNIDWNRNDEKIGKALQDTIQKAEGVAQIDFETIKELSNTQWKEIEKHIVKLDFWNSPFFDNSSSNCGATDGSSCVVEGRKNGKYHFSDICQPEGEIIHFIRYLIKLSELEIDEKNIY